MKQKITPRLPLSFSVVLLSTLSLFIASRSNAQVFPVDTLLKNGSLQHRINLVFISDGYTAAQLPLFKDDAVHFMNSIFSQTPFKEYKNYFNAFAIKVPSAESGAIHPRTSSDNDCPPVPVTNPDNYFGSTFDYGGIHRLLVPTNYSGLASVLAANLPQYDQAFIIVNSPYYGGSGGTFATGSTHNDATEVAIHEIGHSFAFLADEYWAGAGYAAEKPNLTKESSTSLVKWKNWLNTNSVGVYAHSESPTWYRPHQACKMRYLNVEFCPVCRETFTERIHNLTTPVQHFEPAGEDVDVTEGVIAFSVSLLKPSPNTLKTTWKKNSTIIGKNTETVSVAVESLTGPTTIRLEVIDTTALTRNETHKTVHLYVLEWKLSTGEVTGIVETRESVYKVSIFPNPVEDELNFSYVLPRKSSVAVSLTGLDGKRIKNIVKEVQPPGTYDFHLNPDEVNLTVSGTYILSIDIDGTRIAEKIIKK